MSPKGEPNRKQLEAAFGREVPEAAMRHSFWYPAASYNLTFDESYTSWRNAVEALPKQCRETPLLDVTSSWTTGSNGMVNLLLSEFVCLFPGTTLAAPLNVVATPYSADPFFATVQHSLVNAGADVEIEVRTWNPDGTVAADVSFDWRCRVGYLLPLF